MVFKIRENENPEINNLIVTSELPSNINYVLLTNGTCIISTQHAKKIGGQIDD